MSQLNIPIVIGTGREGRMSEKVATFVHEQAMAYGFDPHLIDVRDFATLETENHSAQALEWQKIVTKADGLILIVPEYNHSYPGELKILLDKAEKEYHHKPVGLCTVSTGGIGGTRLAEHMLPIFNTFQLISPKDAIYFTGVQQGFAGGVLQEEYKANYAKKLTGLFDDIAWYAEKLQQK